MSLWWLIKSKHDLWSFTSIQWANYFCTWCELNIQKWKIKIDYFLLKIFWTFPSKVMTLFSKIRNMSKVMKTSLQQIPSSRCSAALCMSCIETCRYSLCHSYLLFLNCWAVTQKSVRIFSLKEWILAERLWSVLLPESPTATDGGRHRKHFCKAHEGRRNVWLEV